MAMILVAEDDLMIADFLEDILIDAGHTVCGIARTVGEAAAMATAHRPDLAILDLHLAQGGRGTDIRALVTGGGRIGILFARRPSASPISAPTCCARWRSCSKSCAASRPPRRSRPACGCSPSGRSGST